jgi:hypothetical protein
MAARMKRSGLIGGVFVLARPVGLLLAVCGCNGGAGGGSGGVTIPQGEHALRRWGGSWRAGRDRSAGGATCRRGLLPRIRSPSRNGQRPERYPDRETGQHRLRPLKAAPPPARRETRPSGRQPSKACSELLPGRRRSPERVGSA